MIACFDFGLFGSCGLGCDLRKSHLALLGVLVVTRMSLSILVYQNPEPAYFPDSASYERLGIGLLDGTAYRWTTDDEAELFRPPGYPAFIAATYGLLGRNMGGLALLQLGLGIGIAFLLYDLGRRLFSPIAGLIAAGLYALDLFSALWGLALLSEPLFTALLITGVYALVRWQLEPKLKWLIVAGLVGGLSTLVRPIGLLLLPAWALIVFLTGRNRNLPKSLDTSHFAVRSTLVFGVALLLIVTPWSVRNKILWNVAGVSSVSGQNLERYLAPAVIMERDGVSIEEARSRLNPPSELSNSSRTAWYATVIWSNPIQYAKAHLRGTLRTIAGLEYIGWFEFLGWPAERSGLLVALEEGDPIGIFRNFATNIANQPIVATTMIFSLGFQLLLYIAGLFGFRRLYRNHPWTVALLAATGAILIFVPGVVGESRFRVPVQPILALLGGVALAPTESRRNWASWLGYWVEIIRRKWMGQ